MNRHVSYYRRTRLPRPTRHAARQRSQQELRDDHSHESLVGANEDAARVRATELKNLVALSTRRAHGAFFRGRTFSPPFVTIRRTSRPEQKRRADGVLVVGDRPVAVENHLLVVLPKNGSRSSCEELIGVLADARTGDCLDRRIRTRHLTVSAISDLPWLDGEADG